MMFVIPFFHDRVHHAASDDMLLVVRDPLHLTLVPFQGKDFAAEKFSPTVMRNTCKRTAEIPEDDPCHPSVLLPADGIRNRLKLANIVAAVDDERDGIKESF